MGRQHSQSQTFVELLGTLEPTVGEPDPEAVVWPSPIRDGGWFDEAGNRWHMRVPDLDLRHARRLLSRPGARALHCYGMHPEEVSGAELEDLLARVEDFSKGLLPPTSQFWLAEFRDDQRAVMLVIEEGC